VSNNLFAQIRPYCFNQLTSSMTSFQTGTVLGNSSNDDQSFNNKPIGFTFNFKGTNFTQFCVSSNGYITLGATSNGVTFNPISDPNDNNVISVLGADLRGQSGSSLKYFTSGTAPNRKLVVQWLNYTPQGTNCNLNFQIQLSETTNAIQFVYGSFTLQTVMNELCEIGLRGSMTNALDFNNVKITKGVNTWDTPEIYGSMLNSKCELEGPSFKPSSGLRFNWVPSGLTNANLSSSVCSQEDATLTATATSGTINWYSDPSSATVLAIGSPYVVQSLVTSDTFYVAMNGCVTQRLPIIVTVNPLPLVNAGPDVTTCEGENIVLNASGALTYNWSGGVTNGVSFTPLTGIYTVTGTDVNGCQNSDQMFVVVGSLPIVIASSNGNGVLSVSSGTTYQWINCETGLPINGQVSQTFTPSANGSYAAIVSNGACSDTSNCVVISSLGMEYLSQTTFEIVPNPTNYFLTLSFSGGSGYIKIFDYQGKEIDAYSVNSGEKLDLTNYSTGIYSIQLSTSAGTSVGRFMKQ
jgi:hypothetical protein